VALYENYLFDGTLVLNGHRAWFTEQDKGSEEIEIDPVAVSTTTNCLT